MRIHISHRTTYRFEQPVHYGLQRVRLTPRTGPTQTVEQWELALSGCGVQLEYDDHFGNRVTLLRTDTEGVQVDIEARGVVLTTGSDGVIGHDDGAVPPWFHLRRTELTEPGDRIRALASEVADETDPVTRLHALSGLIIDQVEYRLGGTEPSTPAEEALRNGHGVCQDHAQIFVAAARLLDVPARYVSGYMMLDDDESSPAGHAWAEANVAGLGWVGFDVSNGISPDDRYVRMAIGRDYREAAPLVGTRYGPGGESLEVHLEVAAHAQQQQQQ